MYENLKELKRILNKECKKLDILLSGGSDHGVYNVELL